MSDKKSSNRTRVIKARLTEEEFDRLVNMERHLNLNRTEIIRSRVLHNSTAVLVNADDLLKLLNMQGTEMGRAGNNINHLAGHAIVLNKQGLLNESVIRDFNELFGSYIKSQREMEKVFRQLIRLMKG